ncbi:protein-glutamine glutaminase family protein [Promicromonospora sukumoe]|uniref:protein-glutamine glutaminase family protein n=1 Tax=Promicromonospora sukumoe TaxID=88382 RepID=UPI0037CAB004
MRLDARTAAPMALRDAPPWPLINRLVPGVTTRPSINQNVLVNASASVRVEAERFLTERFPRLAELNPVHGNVNCNQAVVAVDRMLDGDTAVRIPPSGPGFYGMDLLQTRRDGEFLPVDGYDDVIDRIEERPWSRGVVYVGWDNGSHLFNVVDTDDGVVFLDGQTGHLALLPEDAHWIGLMRYQIGAAKETMPGHGRSLIEPPGQVRRPRQVPRTPANSLTNDVSAQERGSRSLPVQPVEAFYVQSVETLLAASPVRVPTLLALLRRKASTAEARQTPMHEVFSRITGRPLEEVVGDAVRGGRISEVDGDYVLTIAHEVKAPGTSATNHELALPYAHAENMARNAAQFFGAMQSVDMVLGTLGAMDRDLNVLANLRRAWADQYPTSDMEKALIERWPEQGHVIQDLMGYADMAPVPMTQVAEWYRRLLETTFEHVEHGTVPVTPDHPEDGCDIRAYHWSAQLMRWGAMPRQVFATHASDKKLAVKTPYARGARHGAEVTLNWSFHTAPVVQAQTDDGRIVPMVLDPAFDRGPLLIEDWADAMSVPRGSRYVEGGLAEVHAAFVRERHVNRTAWGEEGLPSRHMVLLTDGYARRFPLPTMSRTKLNTSWDDANEEARRRDDRLHRHWVRVVRRDLERSLWSMMQNARSHVTDDAGRQSLLEDMLGTAERYGTLPGFLSGNREVASAAFDLLGEERYFTFSGLFPPVPTGEVLADDRSGIVEVSTDSKGQYPTAGIAQAMQSLVLADHETASLDDVLTARSATPDDDLADLRELAPASLVDMPIDDHGHLGQTVDSVRFDARRFQLASGDWVSEASVRLRIQAGPSTTDADAQLLTDELVSVVEQRVNHPGIRLPGGDLFHLDLVVGADIHAAHHTVALQTAPGSVRSGAWHESSVTTMRSTIDQALHDVTRMVGGTDRHTNPAASDELLMSASDLAAIWQAFQSRPAVKDSPHPLAHRERRRPAGLSDSPRSGGWADEADHSRRSSHAAGTPNVVTDQDGTHWASGSRSARDGEGNLIPDDQRACVQVAIICHD